MSENTAIQLACITETLKSLFLYHCCVQSRSSLYAEYASCVGPETPGGSLALKDVFSFVLNLASGYENMNDNLL